jgi:hypothetical protein
MAGKNCYLNHKDALKNVSEFINYGDLLNSDSTISDPNDIREVKSRIKLLDNIIARDYDIKGEPIAKIIYTQPKIGTVISANRKIQVIFNEEKAFKIDEFRKDNGIFDTRESGMSHNLSKQQEILNPQDSIEDNIVDGVYIPRKVREFEGAQSSSDLGPYSKEVKNFVNKQSEFPSSEQFNNTYKLDFQKKTAELTSEEINLLNESIKEGDIKIDCRGGRGGGMGGFSGPTASHGMVTGKVAPNTKWSVVKDLKNAPTHAQGGVDLAIYNGKVTFAKENSKIEAKYGLRICQK